MSTGIFIKSWLNDLPWLHYALRSINKYARGISEVVVVLDYSCRDKIQQFPGILPPGMITWHVVSDWENGYIQQQYFKLYADQYVKADNILYVDSDCCFIQDFTEADFMLDGKPVVLRRPYAEAGDAKVWQAITEQALGWDVNFEYMPRLPIMYRRDTLPAFRHMTGGLVESLKQMKDRSFSEFNSVGSYIERFEANDYAIKDCADYPMKPVLKQGWSWGGLTEDIRREMEAYLA